ncbi:hypothetical protein Q1695_002737 [Nippostrongylus brasiliensis]|nr:hypothetical protein Q1695_002737 [Nippostrongylus brasiliensis]
MERLLLLCIFVVLGTAMRLRCGNNAGHHNIAKMLLKKDCKGRLRKIDACCMEHTHCYKNRTPRDECDTGFCYCFQDAAAAKDSCLFHALNFCATARAFGGMEYNRMNPSSKSEAKNPPS